MVGRRRRVFGGDRLAPMLLSTVSGYVFAGAPFAPFLARSKAISTRVQPPSPSHSSRARSSFGLRAALALAKLYRIHDPSARGERRAQGLFADAASRRAV